MKWINVLFALLLAGLFFVFSALNGQDIRVDLFVRAMDLPLPVLLFVALFMGVLIASWLFVLRLCVLSQRNRRLNRRLQRLQKDCEAKLAAALSKKSVD